MMSNYRNLGTKEVDEMISIVKRLQEKYKIIDSARTGVYGWSFGGYFSLSVLARKISNTLWNNKLILKLILPFLNL